MHEPKKQLCYSPLSNLGPVHGSQISDKEPAKLVVSERKNCVHFKGIDEFHQPRVNGEFDWLFVPNSGTINDYVLVGS